MFKVDISGKPRADNPLKWDFQATATTKEKIVSIVWYFAPQSRIAVRTNALAAPGYVWTAKGKKTVTVVVVDSKGIKAHAKLEITVGQAPRPAPATPAPHKPKAPASPAPAPSNPAYGVQLFPLPTSLVALAPGVYEVRGFNKGQNSKKVGAANYGVYAKQDILGSGSGKTRLSLVPMTSTKKEAVPVVDGDGGGLANPTNNMYIVRTEGLSRVLRGFTLAGSEQGHLYNGLRVDRVANLTMEDVVVQDIPGNAPGNPGETFAINCQRLRMKAYLKAIRIIGGTGALKSAAGLAFNSCSAKTTIEGLETRALQQSAGIATWQQEGDLEIYGWHHDSPTRNFGAERLAAAVHFYDPSNSQKRTKRGKHDATYTWGDHEAGNFKGGSLTWVFSSEEALSRYLIPGRDKIYVLTNKKSAKQGIKKSARVVVAGKDRTDDLLVWAGA